MRVAHCPKCDCRMENTKRISKRPIKGAVANVQCPQCKQEYNVWKGGRIFETGNSLS